MNTKTTHSYFLVALIIMMCSLFCGYVVLKNYNQAYQISISIADEDEAEQKEAAKELADIFLISPQISAQITFTSPIQKEVISNEFTDYYHYVSPETPPPNFAG